MAPPEVWPTESLYGVQYTCYCPVFYGLVSNAGSGFEGFLSMQGAGEPLHPALVFPSWWSLMEMGESIGAVTQV